MRSLPIVLVLLCLGLATAQTNLRMMTFNIEKFAYTGPTNQAAIQAVLAGVKTTFTEAAAIVGAAKPDIFFVQELPDEHTLLALCNAVKEISGVHYRYRYLDQGHADSGKHVGLLTTLHVNRVLPRSPAPYANPATPNQVFANSFERYGAVELQLNANERILAVGVHPHSDKRGEPHKYQMEKPVTQIKAWIAANQADFNAGKAHVVVGGDFNGSDHNVSIYFPKVPGGQPSKQVSYGLEAFMLMTPAPQALKNTAAMFPVNTANKTLRSQQYGLLDYLLVSNHLSQRLTHYEIVGTLVNTAVGGGKTRPMLVRNGVIVSDHLPIITDANVSVVRTGPTGGRTGGAAAGGSGAGTGGGGGGGSPSSSPGRAPSSAPSSPPGSGVSAYVPSGATLLMFGGISFLTLATIAGVVYMMRMPEKKAVVKTRPMFIAPANAAVAADEPEAPISAPVESSAAASVVSAMNVVLLALSVVLIV